jgi:hypothetical protein
MNIWVGDDANIFYACNMQVYTGKSDGVRQKEQGLRVVKDTVCHQYGSGRVVINDNFFTSYKLANFLSTKNMTLIGKLRKNKPEFPKLFLNGKPNTSILLSLLLPMNQHWYHMYQQETRLSYSFYQGMMTTCAWEKEKIRNPKSSCTITPLKVWLTIWTSL